MPKTFLVLSTALVASCAHGRIPGTQVRDTTQNREVLEVVHKAVDALSNRDGETLLALVSPTYFEDNGTPQPDDDYGYEQLKAELLPQSLAAAKEIVVDLEVQDIVVAGDRAHADLRYRSRAHLQLPAGMRWDSQREFDRLELAREDGQWRITSGL